MPAGAADQRLGIGRGSARRMDVRHHLGRGAGQLRPITRSDLQEVEVFRRMYPNDRTYAVGFGSNDLVSGILCGGQQTYRPLGLLGASLLHATDKKGLRIMDSVLIGIDDLHVVAMAFASLRAVISASL
jgi:hypothetical protein